MSTYIKLEDVQKILSKTSDKYQSEYTGGWISGKIQEDINSLPSISFEEMIKQEIEEIGKRKAFGKEEWSYIKGAKETLEQLLSRLPK